MSDLVSRLIAAIEETERLATNCEGREWGHRFGPAPDGEEPEHWVAGVPTSDTIAICGEDYTMARHHAAHIAHNDPTAVLRRCAADRRRLELHAPEETDWWAEDDEDGGPVEILYCPRCWKGQSCACCAPAPTRGHWPCEEVRLLCDTYGLSVEEETTHES